MFGIKALQNKLSHDIAWTVGSFAVLAASGIIINVVVAALRDASALGVFNLSYAVYIVASQVAVLGIHYSVLRHSAYHAADAEQRGAMLFTGGVMALALGVLAAAAIFLAAPLFAQAFDSPRTGEAIRHAAFGLILFPLNKVLIAYLNGLRHMRAFALLQANRYLLVTAWVSWISASAHEFELAALGFVVAEAVTSVAVLAYLLLNALAGRPRFARAWVRNHLGFGSKSLLAGMFVEMNSRVDVLMIGIFLPDRAVGIYSFAAMLVDGLYHLLAMVRVNYNPMLVTMTRDGEWAAARRLLERTRIYAPCVMAALSALVVLGFWVLTSLLAPEKGMQEGMAALLILLSGLTLISGFIPFDNLLMVSGHPGYQTFQHLFVVVTNVLLNLMLIPLLGIEGAALASATSYVIGIVMLLLFVRRILRWNLFTNQVGL